jgi:hypothetical protein
VPATFGRLSSAVVPDRMSFMRIPRDLMVLLDTKANMFHFFATDDVLAQKMLYGH